MYINPKNDLDILSDTSVIKLVALLKDNGTEVTVKPGEAAIREGQVCDFFFFVQSGSFRTYRYINDKEVIIGFSFKGDIDTAPYAFITNSHSTETIEAITQSSIIKVHRSTLDALTETHPGIKSFTLNMLVHYIEVLVRRHIEFKTYTAEQIYRTLYDRQPDEVHNIPLKFIASYLGISQERLSRIRSKPFNLT
ncbi:Crp/Fnr family transcriptional regulator [Flavobacterium sp. MK4S-17]|uniref:Crp/Fnr family transcriptional regulator n=1 Tax=Flavobacterium sp. MK4S-17 TaxID=2543737 RepID=UPI0013598912|nr:Crp/Fnr family transcriptional regulator [Flavobacterium sp. MK4S-17]